MDSLQRQQFCCNVEQDFSVIAPAGVGKTFSIVERIYSIADKMPEELAHLHVITYTKKAAESLQKRTLERIKLHPRFNRISSFFDQTFFGTIHSLCWNHIRKFDNNHYELLLNDTILKEKFLFSWCQKNFVEENIKQILRFIDLDAFLKVMESIPLSDLDVLDEEIPLMLEPDLTAIYNYKPEPRNKVAIEQKQQALKDWKSQYHDEGPMSLPECLTGGEKFKHIFYETLEPFFDALGKNTYWLAKKISKDYFFYRLSHGYLKHSDLIDHAKNLLKTDKAKDFFQQHKISILLDEAQDTDVSQFQYLQALCLFNSANRFSMVGDPQQAIYSRADLQHYLSLHKRLIAEGKCKELVFSKTFRCPESIVQVLNTTFPKVLNSKIDSQQVDYVNLVSASKLCGKLQKIDLEAPSLLEEPSNYELQKLAELLKQYVTEGRTDLSQICLLCPRNDWLNEAQTYLKGCDITLQLYSNNVTFRDNPFFCTILAFVHLLNFPNDSFEIAGILHGRFRISEKDMTLFPGSLQIAETQTMACEISEQLNALVELRNNVLNLTPWQGILEIMRYFSPYCEDVATNISCRNIILETVSQAQQLGQAWFEIEKKLYQYIDSTIDETADALSYAIQGYSCYKAKGLEWDTVILPFFYRPIRHHQILYPCVWENKLIFNKYAKNFSSELYLARKRELQRLLYVACTRAKKHLIIFNDKVLWKPETNLPSFGDLFEPIS